MNTIDTSSKPCPQPVMDTRRAIEENPGIKIRVIVDNEAARVNVQRFAESSGYKVSREKAGEGKTWLLLSPDISVKNKESAKESDKPDTVFFIKSFMLGTPDEDLGILLMKTFFQTAKEIDPLPSKLVLMHGGVRHAAEGADSLETLKELEDSGVEIIVCGTCLDYYGLKDRLKAGRISNFFEIASVLISSSNTVTL